MQRVRWTAIVGTLYFYIVAFGDSYWGCYYRREFEPGVFDEGWTTTAYELAAIQRTLEVHALGDTFARFYNVPEIIALIESRCGSLPEWHVGYVDCCQQRPPKSGRYERLIMGVNVNGVI